MNQLLTTNIAYDIFVRDKRNTMTCKLLAKKVRYRSNPSSIVRLEQERIPIILSRRRPFLFHFRFPVACRFVRGAAHDFGLTIPFEQLKPHGDRSRTSETRQRGGPRRKAHPRD